MNNYKDKYTKEILMLEGRLEKAYKLPPAERQKWIQKIDEIETRLAYLKEKMNEGEWSDEKAETELSQELMRIAKRWVDGFSLALAGDPLLEKLDDAEKAINSAFKKKDIAMLRVCLRKYNAAVSEIIKAQTDAYAMPGFKEIRDQKQIDETKKVFEVE